ncbi:homeobox protein CDX-1-like [Salvelinus sp. IW2-2015]|uniref:homeobox protein CDX-1-like n=1 Tax=Salvelinus sp. IW2-2015 TaxID=2691554 RepID=UPI0038D483EC
MTRMPRRQESGEIRLLRISTGGVVTVWFPRSDIHPASGAGSSSITQLTCWAVLREKKLVRLNQTQCTFIQYRTFQQGKYRVVNTYQQRLELEKECQYSRYITIRRKTELALGFSLSERQVQIWFQNSRYITIRRKTELALGFSLSERQVQIWFRSVPEQPPNITIRRKTEAGPGLQLSERQVQICSSNSRYITIRKKDRAGPGLQPL